MPSSQKIIVLGHLAGDPELKYTPNGNAVVNFSIPVQEYYDKQQNRTNWFRCVAIGKRAETMAEHLQKGDLVQLELKKQDSSWDGRDGKKQYKTEFFVADAVFLRVQSWEQGEPESQDGFEYPEPDDDIPF